MIEKIKANIDEHKQTIDQLTDEHINTIADIANAIIKSLQAGGKLLLAGNGGSAADAQHVAGEFIGRLIYDRRPLPAITLSADTSVMTCVANDYDFDQVFVRQIEALASPGDVFWAFSTSGNSANVVKAAEAARKRNVTVVAFTGSGGGELARIADVCLAVPAEKNVRIQEAHTLAYHIVCQLVEETLCPKRPK